MEAVKTLGESYEGCLSRDWEKLLDILDAGKTRIAIFPEKSTNRSFVLEVSVINEVLYPCPYYNLRGMYPNRETAIGRLERSCAGWFPTKDDFPALSVEPAPLEWNHYQDGTSLASDGDWLLYADDYGDWNIRLNGIVVVQAYEKGIEPSEGYMDAAKAAIHEWRVNHLNSMTKK